jgi:hypothetical protein
MPVVRTAFAPALPDGRFFTMLERRGEVVLTFVEGEISPRAAREMTETFQACLDSEAWTQNWADPGQPGSAHSRAS